MDAASLDLKDFSLASASHIDPAPQPGLAARPAPTPYADARAMSGMLAVVFCLAACWYFAASTGIVDPSGRHAVGRDFINLWTAGRLVCEGRAETVFDVHGFHGVQESLVG